jgi:tRNA nucleotidyltransferase (CCA-adding enzyme)
MGRVKERGTHVTVVVLPRPGLVDDTLYPQIRKAGRAIAEQFARDDFPPLGWAEAVDSDRIVLVFELAYAHRSAVRRQDGPPAGIDRVGHFLEKWLDPEAPVLQGPYVREDGSLAIETRRTGRSSESVLREAFPRLSLGRDLTSAGSEEVEIVPLTEARESPGLGEALRELLAKRLPWLEPRTGAKR